MIIKAKDLTKQQRQAMDHPFFGVYTKGDYDLLASIMTRYPTAVVTLETALSLYGITDVFLAPPFFLSFNIGYRPAKDDRIIQIWEDKATRLIGAELVERDGVKFLCYDKERLLLELFRREKLISMDAFQAAVFHYRKLASDGALSLPRLRDYCRLLPKGDLFRERIRKEIL